MNQYIDVLSGALLEARKGYQAIQTQAGAAGKTVEQFIAKHLTNADSDFVASGRIMKESVERFERYQEAWTALTSASVWYKPIVFLRYLDLDIWKAMRYEVALPLGAEAVVYAGIGFVLGSLVFYLLLGLPASRMLKSRRSTV